MCAGTGQHDSPKSFCLRISFSVLIIGLLLLGSPGSGIALVIFEEGFESGNGSSFSQSPYGSITGNPQYSVQDSVKATGVYALRHHFNLGQGGSYATKFIGDNPEISNPNNDHYHDLYIQFKLRYSEGYDFSAGNNKIMIIGTEDDRRHDTICCNPWVASYITLLIGHSGSSGFFDTEGNNKRAPTGQWIALPPNRAGYSNTNRFTTETGRWYTIEVHIRLNDPNQSNGIFEMWIDGVKVSEHSNVLYRIPWDGTAGSNFNYGINFVMLSHYIDSGAPQAQDMYYDEIKINTQYMGTGSSPLISPSPPRNLKVN
ncbi:MAG: hypothetical protein E4G97_00030 [Deltaproteobacteria bacterium]|nr:MAG: hypothetical protein E4G97_00030 [Deltaproteobacteria bacterium]